MSASSAPRLAQGRVHPLALALAVLIHGAGFFLLLRVSHPVPPPVAVTFTLDTPPVQNAAAASLAQLIQPTAEPATVAPASPPPALVTSPPPPDLAPAPTPSARMATADAMQPSPPPTVVPLAPPDSDVPTEAPAPMSAAAVAQAAAEPPPETLPVPPPVAQPSVPPVETKPDTRVFRPPQPRHAPRVPPKRSEPPATPASQPTAQPAPPPASSRASSPAAAATINPSWTNELGAWLQAHKSYPELARERGEEGTVAVRLTVARDGRVLNVAVARGSGSGTLDGAAAAMLRNARVPPFPFSMPPAEVTVTVALRYMLER